jgi:hypothetical protein
MTAGAAVPRSVRHKGHIRTAATEAAETAIGITTYDADGDHRRHHCRKAISYGATGGRGKEAIDRRITNTI